MSIIHKMQISGIRSFNPDRKEMIEFSHPLTLILGPNGTGKTTIIECLKYITTGDMPPNAKKDGGFVHDPKVLRVTEVKAQVKLQFTDVHQRGCVATRSLQSTQKNKKVECKTLDSIIKRRTGPEPDSEIATINNKCAEMDSEMIALLGVSKPILENVIFVHQEEANWPLSEAKTLKEKFDAIFASTRYVKALDQIKKCYKLKGQDINNFKTEIKYLKVNKDKAQEIQDNLTKAETKYVSSRELVENVELQLEPIEKDLDKIANEAGKLNQIYTDIEKLKGVRAETEKNCSELRKQIKNEFQGTSDELRKELTDFEEKVGDMKANLSKYESQDKKLGINIDQLSDEKGNRLLEQGKLEQEAKENKRNINDRNRCIREFASKYKVRGYDDDVSEEEAKSFKGDHIDRIAQSVMKTASEKKSKYEEEEADLKKQIDDEKHKKTALETERDLKITRLRDAHEELRTTKIELNRIEASSERLNQLTRELQFKETELEEAKGSADPDSLKEEIIKRKSDRIKKATQVSKLEDEVSRLSEESVLRSQLDTCRKDKASRTDQVNRLRSKNDEGLVCVFGSGKIPTDDLKRGVDRYLSKKQNEISSANSELTELKGREAKLETEKMMNERNLTTKEEECRAKKKEIVKVHDGDDFERELDQVQIKLQKKETDVSFWKATQRVFRKYLEDLAKKPACPLCHRSFEGENSDQNIAELNDDIRSRLEAAPDKLARMEKEMERCHTKYKSMLQLKPTRNDVVKLEAEGIPQLQSKIKSCSEELGKIRIDIEEKEEYIEGLQVEESIVRSLQSDAAIIDKTQREIQDLDTRITADSAKISNAGSKRTLQDAKSEKDDAKFELETMDRKIEQCRDRLEKYNSNVQTTQAAVQELVHEKLSIQKDLQEKENLEKSKVTLENTVKDLDGEIKDAKMNLKPIQDDIDDLEDKKADITRTKERQYEKDKEEYNKIKDNAKEILRFQRDIDKYVDLRKADKFEESKRAIIRLEKSLQDKLEEKDCLAITIQDIKDEISSQKVQERELKDNMQLRRNLKEMEMKTRKIDVLEKEIEAFDVNNLNKKQRDLERQQEDLKHKRGIAKGRMGGHEDEIVRCKKELKEDQYADADKKYQEMLYNLKTTEMAKEDLDKYYNALDQTIMRFHKQKMDEINKIISELWRNTYKGNDIETIEIRTEGDDEGKAGQVNLDKRRTIQYRVVMMKGEIPIDMRGRCSAGQKVLASLIIRLALAETFCLNCGILALDEPTTNLDRENIESLAYALIEIVKNRTKQKNFQLIVITHDEDFIELMGRANCVDQFFKVRKDMDGCSSLVKAKVSDIHQR